MRGPLIAIGAIDVDTAPPLKQWASESERANRQSPFWAKGEKGGLRAALWDYLMPGVIRYQRMNVWNDKQPIDKTERSNASCALPSLDSNYSNLV